MASAGRHVRGRVRALAAEPEPPLVVESNILGSDLQIPWGLGDVVPYEARPAEWVGMLVAQYPPTAAVEPLC